LKTCRGGTSNDKGKQASGNRIAGTKPTKRTQAPQGLKPNKPTNAHKNQDASNWPNYATNPWPGVWPYFQHLGANSDS